MQNCGVEVMVTVGVTVNVAVHVFVMVGVNVGVKDGVCVSVHVNVGVMVEVGVKVGVTVSVGVIVKVSVHVYVGVIVGVTVRVPLLKLALLMKTAESNAPSSTSAIAIFRWWLVPGLIGRLSEITTVRPSNWVFRFALAAVGLQGELPLGDELVFI